MLLQLVSDPLNTAEPGRDIGAQRLHFSSASKTIRSDIEGRNTAHCMPNLLKQAQSGGTYNVGPEQLVSIQELSTTIWEVVGVSRQIEVGDPPKNAVRTVHLPNISKAGNLGLRIETTLHEAQAQMASGITASKRPEQVATAPML